MKIKNTEIILNCLAKDLENAKAIYEASNKQALIGILTKSFESDEDYIKEANRWSQELDGNISIGLGGGDPQQSFMVTRVSKQVKANHINQVFTGVAATTEAKQNKNAIVNALISPTGITGEVKISTGPYSSQGKDAIVPAKTALAMIKDMKGNAIKFFNMKGLAHIDEAKELIKLSKEFDLVFEPTGGLDISNSIGIIKECINQGVKKVIVHIYSSIINKTTGETDIKLIQEFWKKVEALN